MDISQINGGTVMAMAGANCFTIASDLRLGSQMLTVTTTRSKVFKMGDHLYAGIPGLATDSQTIHEHLRLRTNLYELRENRQVSPEVMTSMLSNLLYEKRFGPYFCEPIVAGLCPRTNEPLLTGMDLIGNVTKSGFVISGTGEETLFGVSEALWEPNMDPESLFQTTSQSFLAAMERDALSGNGILVYTVTPTSTIIKTLKCRMD